MRFHRLSCCVSFLSVDKKFFRVKLFLLLFMFFFKITYFRLNTELAGMLRYLATESDLLRLGYFCVIVHTE